MSKVMGRVVFVAVAMAASGGFGCSTWDSIRHRNAESTALQIDPQMPAAEAKVMVEPEKNQQRVTIEAKHLADPSQVRSGATVYVVWLEPANDRTPQNIGVLNVNRDKEGKLETITPYREFRVFVTAERAPNVTSPSRQLMTAAVKPTGVTY